MPALHVVCRSPQESQALTQCLTRAGEGDVVLLSENGVYAALVDSVASAPIRAASPQRVVYVLMPDCEARGILAEEILPGVAAVDYDGFVDLAVRFPIIHCWS